MARKGFTEDDRLWKEQILIRFLSSKQDKKKNLYFSFSFEKGFCILDFPVDNRSPPCEISGLRRRFFDQHKMIRKIMKIQDKKDHEDKQDKKDHEDK